MAWEPISVADEFVATARSDYAGYMEETGGAPPVAFADRTRLHAWLDANIVDLKIEPCGNITDSISSRGWLRDVCSGSGYFQQIWVAKCCRRYRDAMKWVAEHRYMTTDLTGVDADHVVARTVLKHSEHAWVAIFPVYKGINRPAGHIEKLLPKFDERSGIARLTPTAAFKIFAGRMPRDLQEYGQAMKDVRGQLQSRSDFMRTYLGKIETDMKPCFNDQATY